MKGFTLIELLAVIVILAIIALIATPIVLGIINDSKNSATIRSAGYYIEAVKHAIMKKNLELQVPIDPKECTVISNSYINCDEVELEVEVEGELPDSGSITFDRGKTTSVELIFGERTVVTNSNGELVLEDSGENDSQEPKLAAGLYDENDNLIATWDELVEKHDIKFAIETMGGLVAEILENYDGESKLVIDESVTFIGMDAFSGCSSLTDVIIPDSVTGISIFAFASLQLKNVIIPNRVTYIGNDAFSSNQLTSVVIPSSVITIDENPFKNNPLVSIVVDENNSVYDSRNNSNAIIKTATNELITGSENTKIPDSVTSIGFAAFYGNISLTNITIPNSVTYIGALAFYECDNLTSITIPNSVTLIDGSAFSGCDNLTTINFTGTEAEWNAIVKWDYWDDKTPSDKVINYNYTG